MGKAALSVEAWTCEACLCSVGLPADRAASQSWYPAAQHASCLLLIGKETDSFVNLLKEQLQNASATRYIASAIPECI